MAATDIGLARDFGYDITMPDGNMGLPSAVHKEYMERCNILYKEFVTNMSLHMKEVKVMKKELRSLHEEKMRHLRFSLYRTGCDPFARHHNSSTTPTGYSGSRNNTPWGLDIIPDEDNVVRPLTAPPGTSQRHANVDVTRPKTAGHGPDVDQLHGDELGGGEGEDDDDVSETGLSQLSGVSKSTVVGVLDRKLEQSSSRKILVGQHSFNKIAHGKVRAKIKYRDGRFVVKPIRVNHDTGSSVSDTVAFDPLKSRNAYDPLYERLALVRKITNFKTPTISTDMKINNRVPIQKSLKGIDAKRTTISEIYQNARDRKTRHFRIVSNTPRPKSAMQVSTDKADRKVAGTNDAETRSKSAAHDRNFGSRLSHNHGYSREGTPVHGANRDEIDHIASANNTKPRSILTSVGSSKGLNDSFNGREMLNSTSTSVGHDEGSPRRPHSKVAFVRADSHVSTNGSLQTGDSVSLSASMTNSSGIAKQFGKRLTIGSADAGRSRTASASSDISGVFKRQPSADDTSRLTHENLPHSPRVENIARMRLGIPGQTGQSRGLDDSQRSDSKLSMSSVGTTASAIVKFKSAVNKKGEKRTEVEMNGMKQKLGFQAPIKLESRSDSVNIVRQQIRQDKQLDERMTVWKRRMAARSSIMSSKSIMFKSRGKKFR